MIVDPDFFDHWKTLLLIEELEGDQAAPVYILRLWAHCQNRRQWIFDSLSEKALKALCRYPGHPRKLMSALTVSGFICLSKTSELTVVGWDEYNAQLIANWENGKRGGRPKGSKNRPRETHGLAMGNPSVTQREPIGEDRRREDIKPTPPSPARAKTKSTTSSKKPPGDTSDDPFTDPQPHPEWADQWQCWVDSWQGREDRRFDAIKAQHQLGQLLGRDPAKALRDLEFSLNRYAKRILDSDDDWDIKNAKSPRVSGTKCELDI